MQPIEIIDDLFDERYIHNLFPMVTEKLPFTAGNTANRSRFPYGESSTHKLFGCKIFERASLNRISYLNMDYATDFFDIFEAIQLRMQKEFYLDYINVNCQHQFCEGSFHTDGDSDQKTIMLMLNPTWKQEWGGAFEIQDPFAKGTQVFNYVPGRVIVFPSHLKHRGHAPTKEYLYRYTVVFRVSNY